MSYMGSIGYIMGGSGIQKLWEEVYAPDSLNHMITGHTYSRALRAHFLKSAAVTGIIQEFTAIKCRYEVGLPTYQVGTASVKSKTSDVWLPGNTCQWEALVQR